MGKTDKNWMKITKSIFLGKTLEGHEGVKPVFWLVVGFPPIPPLGETLLILVGEIKKQHDLEYLNLFL